MKRYPKCRFCKTCKEDFAALKRDAGEAGQEMNATFDEECQHDANIIKMVKEFQKTCQSRGRGTPIPLYPYTPIPL
eukprot:16443414-Heterocapsa_arctica.AAC.1